MAGVQCIWKAAGDGVGPMHIAMPPCACDGRYVNDGSDAARSDGWDGCLNDVTYARSDGALMLA